MIFSSFFKNYGILGINARNLLYTRFYNEKAAKAFADDKIKTKQFLSARGIRSAKLFGVIRHEDEVDTFDWLTLPGQFVIKPNSGYGGEGILIFREKVDNGWKMGNKKVMTLVQLKDHVRDILAGRFSVGNLSEAAIFEQCIITHPVFLPYTYKGLPDLRIVVFNLVPIMAMLRLPTRESEGKANLHQGAAGVGIDIVKGECTHTSLGEKIVDTIPGVQSIKGLKIPFWEEILLISAKAQQISGIGYMAIDVALDESGPLVLELNARAGLNIQIANLAPLRVRLEKVKGVKVTSPEQGIEVSKQLFGGTSAKKTEMTSPEKPIIGMFEQVTLFNGDESMVLLAKVDLCEEKTFLDSAVFESISPENREPFKISVVNTRLQTVISEKDFSDCEWEMTIGRRDLRGFLLDPSQIEIPKSFVEDTQKKLSEIDKKEIDTLLDEIDSSISLLYHLRPLNLSEEKEKFFKDLSYNPQFTYREIKFNAPSLLKKIERISYDESSICTLLQKKGEEIMHKISLIKSCGNSTDFTKASKKLYGHPLKDLVEKSKKQLAHMPKEFEEVESLTTKDIVEIFREVLDSYGLQNWEIHKKKEMVGNVTAGKSNFLFIRDGLISSPERMKQTVAHEIETHILRAENGRQQPYKILQRGTAHYLEIEEGLAIYNQKLVADDFVLPKDFFMYGNVFAIDYAMKHSFLEVFQALIDFGFSLKDAWNMCVKVKRGLADTSEPGAFTKDAIYFSGYEKIRKFIKKGGDERELYMGKITIDDIEIVQQISQIQPPKILPSFLLS